MKFNPKMQKTIIRLLFLADQAVFSFGNFLMTVMLARQYSEVELTVYGVALSTTMMLLGIQRNIYIVQNTIIPPKVMRNRAAKVMGQHLIFSGLMLSVEILWAIFLNIINASYYSCSLAYMMIVVTLIYGQLGFDKMMLVKHERYVTPLMTSIVFTIMIALLMVIIPVFHISFYTTMIIIGVFPIMKLLWLINVVAKPDFKTGWGLIMRSLRRYLFSSLVGLVGSSGFSHFPVMVLGTVASPLQTAAYVAMRSLTQPLGVFARSLDVVEKNFFHHKPVMTPSDMRAVLVRQMLIYIVPTLLLAGFFAFFGDTVIHILYGEKYAHFSHILVGWTLLTGLITLTMPIETGIIKMKKLNLFNNSRIIAGGVGIILSLILCKPYGAIGALTVSFTGNIISLLIGIWIVRDIFLAKAPVNKMMDDPLSNTAGQDL